MQETIWYNGTILTMEDSKKKAQAVLVRDGIITAVGNLCEVESKKQTQANYISLQGKTMLPGFIDAHSHLTAFAQTLGVASLSDVTSIPEIMQRLQSFQMQREIKPGQWIVGVGYDHNFVEEKRHPNKLDLDMFIENPVMVVHASGHMGVTNSLGLEKLGLNQDTPNPEGGTFGRMPDGKQLDGYMEENAFLANSKEVLQLGTEKIRELLEQAQQEYLKRGITTVQDGLVKEKEFTMLKQHEWIVDVIGYVDIMENRQVMEQNPDYVQNYQNGFKLGGYKLILDGSPQGKTAWMSRPYEGEKDDRGYPTHSNQQVEEAVELALSQNIQLLTHCNGDAAADQLLTAFEIAERKYTNTIRPVMIHAQTIRYDQLDKMKKLGIIPSYFIAHIYYWGDIHLKNLGKRADTISPAKTTIQKQILYTFHQDTPVILPNMLETIWCSVNRKTKQEVVLGEQERIEVYEALKAVTINAAYQYFEQDKKGSIKEGKIADFVILDQNPLEIEKEKIKDIQVLETIRKGKSVYQNKEQTIIKKNII